MAHKRTIITADQNNYVITNADNVARFILHILQIILLIITRNYIAYLVLRIAQAFFTNLVLTIYANKKYPYINQTKETISKDLQKPIMKNVGALLFHKVGWVAVSGTTTIIISSFVGIVSAGMYGNYTLVTAGVTTFVALIFTSLIASIGNLCSVSEQDIQEKVFKKIDYISNWISFFCFICFVCLFTPFIALWIGEENIFSMPITIAISLSAVVAFLRKSLVSFKDAKGMFWNDRYKPIAVAIVGIALAVGLSYVWGVFGIIIGYTLANLLIALPVEAYVVYKHGFNMSCVPVLLKKLLIIIFALVSCVIVYFVCSLITIGGIWGFAIQVLICLILPNIFFFLATFWTDEFKYFKSLAFSLIHKILKRKKTVDKDIAKANQSQENDVEKVEIQEHNDDTQLKPNASQECECEKCEEEQNPNK